MVMRGIVKAAKAVSNPAKTARTIDKGISKAVNVGKKINNAVDTKSLQRYRAADTKAQNAVKAYKASKWPMEKAVTKRIATKAVSNERRERQRDLKVADAANRVRNYLSKYSK